MLGFTHVEINIGKRKAGHPDMIADITNHIELPVELPDDSGELIFSRATMEHLTYPELINCFLENYRLLKTGRVVRMLVPDFDIMIQDYLNKTYVPSSKHAWSKLTPVENHSDYFVVRVLYHDHYYLHNFDTLSRALSKCGFVNIRKAKPGDTIVQEVHDVLHEAEKALKIYNPYRGKYTLK